MAVLYSTSFSFSASVFKFSLDTISQPVELDSLYKAFAIKFLNTVWNVKLSMIIQVCFFPYLSFKLEACIHAYYAGFFKQIIKDMLSWRTN